MRGKYGGDAHVSSLVFGVALYGFTVENAALTLSLVGHPWFILWYHFIRVFLEYFS